MALGEANVGKTKLLFRIATRSFENTRHPTIIDTLTVNIMSGKNYERFTSVMMWDTAGQERFKALRTNTMKNCQGGLIVFDSTKPSSLATAKEYCKTFLEAVPAAQCALVANKYDLYSQGVDADNNPIAKWIDDDVMTATALEMGCTVGFFKCSAATGLNVDEAFVKMINFTVDKQERLGNAYLAADKKKQEKTGTVKLTRSTTVNSKKTTTIKCCSK